MYDMNMADPFTQNWCKHVGLCMAALRKDPGCRPLQLSACPAERQTPAWPGEAHTGPMSIKLNDTVSEIYAGNRSCVSHCSSSFNWSICIDILLSSTTADLRIMRQWHDWPPKLCRPFDPITTKACSMADHALSIKWLMQRP